MATLSTTTRGEARRAEILQAARTCFLRDGFHATSMQDLLRATGLSAGAFYRYFPSKQAIVSALAEAAMAETAILLVEEIAADPPPLEAILCRVIETIELMDGHDGGTRIGVLLWGESQRDPDLKRTLVKALSPLFGWFEKVATIHQSRGALAADVAPANIARALIGQVQGYIVQRALFGTSAADYCAGVAALISTAPAVKPKSAGRKGGP